MASILQLRVDAYGRDHPPVCAAALAALAALAADSSSAAIASFPTTIAAGGFSMGALL